jgi:hypothetical protein
LFIEEHGLRLLLERDGVGVELSREDYEGGNWAAAVERAWNGGSEAKWLKRLEGETGERQEQVREMGRKVMDWIVDWKWKCAEQSADEVEESGKGGRVPTVVDESSRSTLDDPASS